MPVTLNGGMRMPSWCVFCVPFLLFTFVDLRYNVNSVL